jgi:hypothetical protein
MWDWRFLGLFAVVIVNTYVVTLLVARSEENSMASGLNRRSSRRMRDRLVIAVFAFCIAAPALVGALGVTEIPEFTENRTLKPFPKLASGADAFLRDLDGYISDRFGFRPLLITSVNYLKLLMQVPTNRVVVFGKDGWLFAYVQKNSHDADVESYARAFVERADWIEHRGAQFTIFVVPRKEVIYQEYLPRWMGPAAGGASGIDMFRAALGAEPIDVFYPKEAMLDDKAMAKLFYRYDMHWTPAGAFFGAKALLDHLHERNHSVPVFAESDYTLDVPGPECIRRKYDGGRLDLLVLQGAPALSERCPDVARKGGWTAKEALNSRSEWVYTKDDPSLPTAVFYSDSFGPGLRRIVAEYFRRSVFVHPFAEGGIIDKFAPAAVKEEKPDIVVYLRTEWALYGQTDNPPEVRNLASGVTGEK